MNKLIITGHLTRDVEIKQTTINGQDVDVCNFTVAVNRRQRGKNEQGDADFFRVTAWRGLAQNCAKYLSKGKHVLITGSVSGRAYKTNDGEPRASLEVTADDVEFLSPAGGNTNRNKSTSNGADAANTSASDGFTEVQTHELPF